MELKKAHFRGVYRVKVPLPTILHRWRPYVPVAVLSTLCHGKYDRFYPPSSSFSSFSLSDCLRGRLLRFIKYVTSVRSCIDAGTYTSPTFFPSLPPPPSPSLLSFQLRRAESGWIIVSYRLSRILRALAGSVHCITIAILLVLWLIPRIARTELSLWYLVSIHRKKEGREVVLRLEFASRDFIERVRTLTMIPHRYC